METRRPQSETAHGKSIRRSIRIMRMMVLKAMMQTMSANLNKMVTNRSSNSWSICNTSGSNCNKTQNK